MDRDVYDALTDHVNFSTLKKILDCPLAYKDELERQRELAEDDSEEAQKERDAEIVRFAVGSLCHSRLLENKDLTDLFAIKPKKDSTGRAMSFATKEGKEWRDAQTKPILTAKQADVVPRMADSVCRDPDAMAILRLCPKREHAIVTEFMGVPVKALLDLYGTDASGAPFIPDFKTTRDNSPKAFAKQAADARYPFQLCFYGKLAQIADGLPEETVPKGAWITVKNDRPFTCQCYFPSETTWRVGRRDMNRAMELLLTSRKTGIWPAYGGGLQELDLPRWAQEDL